MLLEQQKQQQLLDLVGGPKPQAPPPVAPSTAFVKRNQVIPSSCLDSTYIHMLP